MSLPKLSETKFRVIGPAVNKIIDKIQLAIDAAILTANPFNEYHALLSQSSTGAPTAVIVNNTLGGTVVLTRTSAGLYRATLTGAFPIGTTLVSITNQGITGAANIFGATRGDNNYIAIATSTGGTLTDGLLSSTPFMIRVKKA